MAWPVIKTIDSELTGCGVQIPDRKPLLSKNLLPLCLVLQVGQLPRPFVLQVYALLWKHSGEIPPTPSVYRWAG